jgi:hypothetical protein
MKRLGLARWWWLWPIGVIGIFLVILVLPEWLPRRRSGVPPASLLVGVGLLVGVVGAVLLAAGVSRLGAPRRAVVASAAGALCVVVAKFTFAPLGFYDANQDRVLYLPTEGFLGIGIVVTGLAVLALYAAVLRALYALLLPRAGEPVGSAVVVRAVVGVLVLAGIFALCAVAIGTPMAYVEFVLSSIAAGGVAVSLLFAISAFAIAFTSTAERAKAAGDVGAYTALFGLALGFLIVFHVLWIVYLLTLAAIWPLRTVAPK